MRIAVRDLSFGHTPGVSLFEGIDIELLPGVLYAVIGPSGSGKSTLLSLIAGFRKPAAGAIERESVERIGWVLQNPLGAPRRTALDQVIQPLLYRGLSRTDAERQARSLLERFHLGDIAGREFRLLSGGEAQRLAFARSVASAPDALLLDEPTAQLDPTTAESVRQVVRGLAGPERIVLLATHDRALSEQCDAIIDLADHRAAA